MARRPHLLCLMADQLRGDVLGAFGGRRLLTREPAPKVTPRLDTLAGMSALFDRHFTPCPLCVPARSSLMTGLHTHQHGAIINGWCPREHAFGTVRAGLPLLPQRLVDAGYRVGHVGVQHVRTQPRVEQLMPNVEWRGPIGVGQHHAQLRQRDLMLPSMEPFRDPCIDYDDGQPIVNFGTNAQTGVFPLREDLFYDAVIAEHLVEFIHSHRDAPADKPMALFGMFWLPHPPFIAPQRWANLIEPDEVRLPPTVGQWIGSTPAMQLANFPGQLGAHVPMEQWQKTWAMYLGMTAMLDHCVGKVLAALDHAGMLDDTLVIFTSDHGEMLGSRRMLQKMCLYEESVRVPLMIKPPGHRSMRRVTDLTSHLDLTTTLLAAAEQPATDLPGMDLLALAEGRTPEGEARATVFAAYDGNAGRGFQHRMARSRSHKLIHNIGHEPELYDLIDDPRETRNLFGHAGHQQVQQELVAALNQWMDDCDDAQPRLALA